MALTRNHRKIIADEAKQILKDGHTKQGAYLKLAAKYKHPYSVSEILRKIPSGQAIAKHRKTNNILSGLLIAHLYFLLFPMPLNNIFAPNLVLWYYLPILVQAGLIYLAVNFQARYYGWIAIFSAYSFIFVITKMIVDFPNIFDVAAVIFKPILTFPCIIIALRLKKSMLPVPIEKVDYYLDKYGHTLPNTSYKFND